MKPATASETLPSVMVVDDDEDLLWLLTRTLKQGGFSVKSFTRPPSMRTLREIHPAVLFLDVEIGAESGEEVCGQIKSEVGTAYLPVILISSHNTEKLRATALRCGADGYLNKPFNLEGMKRLAQHYVDRRAA